MMFTMEAKTLASWLSVAASAISSQMARVNAALEMICVEVESDRILLASGTDLDTLIRAREQCEPDFKGDIGDKFLLPAAQCIAFVSRVNGLVTMGFADDGLSLAMTCGKSTLTLKTLPASQWPELLGKGYFSHFEVHSHVLMSMLSATVKSAEVNGSRLYLQGVYLNPHANGKALTAVAVDGHRMSIRTTDVDCGDVDRGVIVPLNFCRLILKHIKNGTVSVGVSESTISITCGDLEMKSKLIDDQFPDYERITPPLGEINLSVDADDFLAALSRLQILTEKTSKGVRLSFDHNGNLEMSFTNQSGSKSIEIIHCDGWLDDKREFVFGANAKYLEGAFADYKGEVASFSLADSSSPIRVQRGTVKQDDWNKEIEVVMPLRV